MKVFVTGGSGYVGGPLLTRLVAAGHHVVALERPNTKRPVSTPQVDRVVSDLFDEKALLEGARGCDAMIHLVGIIREQRSRGITMSNVHVSGTRAVLNVARTAGIQKFIYLSALGARPNARSNYHRSKWEGECLVRKSGLDFTIFRPSVIFGQGGPGPEFVGLLRNLVARAPVVPVIGDGMFYLQPVSIETVAAAVTNTLQSPVAGQKTYELGGPAQISYKQILVDIASAVGKPLRGIRVPVGLMKWFVPVLERFPAFPLSSDQLTMLLEGNVCVDTDRVYTDLNLPQVPFQVTP